MTKTGSEIRKERELAEANKKFDEQDHYYDGDVILWKSNNRSPMSDMMGNWLELGLIDLSAFRATEKAREEQYNAFFDEYRKEQANRTPEELAEEAFELRANFDPGTVIVNVITGERTVV